MREVALVLLVWLGTGLLPGLSLMTVRYRITHRAPLIEMNAAAKAEVERLFGSR
jgi:hypothetical protein